MFLRSKVKRSRVMDENYEAMVLMAKVVELGVISFLVIVAASFIVFIGKSN